MTSRLAGAPPATRHPYLQRLDQCVVGQELRLLVETSVTVEPRDAHYYTTEVKAWYVAIDLGSKAALPERTKVYGPLWEVPGTRPARNYDQGAHRLIEQAKAEGAGYASPHGEFTPEGTLLRYAGEEWSVLQRAALVISPTGGTWQAQGETRPLAAPEPRGGDDRLSSAARRYVLLYENGQATLYDCYTGLPVADKWLTRSFRSARALPYAPETDVRQFLTDDLNHLVINPRGPITIEGRSFPAGSVDLIWDRPEPKMKIYPHPPVAGKDEEMEDPHGAFVRAGQLFLFANTAASLQLYTPDRTEKHVAAGPPFWPIWSYGESQFIPDLDELVFYDFNPASRKESEQDVITVILWNYVADTHRIEKLPLRLLFEQHGGQLAPKHLLPVK